MTEGLRCRSCGLENAPGRDFCERCGEYLAWAPTTMVAAVPESAVRDDEAATTGQDPQTGGDAGDAGVGVDDARGATPAGEDPKDGAIRAARGTPRRDAPGADPEDGGEGRAPGAVGDGSADTEPAAGAPPAGGESAAGAPGTRAGAAPGAGALPGAGGAPGGGAAAGAGGAPGGGAAAGAGGAPGGGAAAGAGGAPGAGVAAGAGGAPGAGAVPGAADPASVSSGELGSPAPPPDAAPPATPGADLTTAMPVLPPPAGAPVPGEGEGGAPSAPRRGVPKPRIPALRRTIGRRAAPPLGAPPAPATPPPPAPPAEPVAGPAALESPPPAASTAPQSPPTAAPAAPQSPPTAAPAAPQSPPTAQQQSPPPTAWRQQPPPPPPQAAAAAPTASGDASLVVAPADPAVGLGGVPAVEAGAALGFRATIRNESQIVDNYDLAILGLPEGWAVTSPAAAFLVPLGSGRGDSELELRVDITPPRDYRSTAGIWTFELIALSRTHGTVAARAIAQFEVRPFQAWSVEVVPTVNAGRLKARYRLAVRNDGNAEQELWPVALEDSGKLRTKFTRGHLALEAGAVGADTLTLRPRFPKPVGRVTEHRVGVDVVATAPEPSEAEQSLKEKMAEKAKEEAKKTASGVKVGPKGVTFPRPKLPRLKNPLAKLKLDASTLSRLRGGPGDASAPLTARQIVFRQKPLIPLWFIGLLLLLALAGILLYLLLPRKVSVPKLVDAPNSFVALKRLRAEGLVLAQPVQNRIDADADAGSVIEQVPSAGTKVDKGAAVSIVVAGASTTVDVPHLEGLTTTAADARLRKSGLQLGDTQPSNPPDKYVVRSQIPDADLSVPRGTSVRIFLRKPPPTAKQKKVAAKKKAKAAATAAAAKKTAADTVTIPKFAKMTVTKYVAALQKLGLKTTVVTAAAPAAAGSVIAVVPAVGKKAKKGAQVTVRGSSGPSPLAIQTTSRTTVLNPIGGKELFALPGTAVEPSYFPDGSQLIYRSGSKFLVMGTGAGAKPHTVYDGSDDLVRPTMAPDGVTLAMIRVEEGDGDLCFGRVDQADVGELCLPDDGWDLDGRITWSKNGKMVLVGGQKESNPAIVAVREYTTTHAFTTEPLLWKGRTATPETPGKGVLSMTFSPGGTRIAAIANLDGTGYQVVFTDSGDLSLQDAKPTGTAACDVTWRPDGQELAAVQSDAACTQPLGKVVRFTPGAPTKTQVVVAKGQNPVYRPGS